MRALPLVAACLLAGCGTNGGDGGDADADVDADTDGDADSDTDCSGCEGCIACANGGPCGDESTECGDDPACADFVACVGEHDDPTTIAQCRAANAAGADLFCAWQSCLVYDVCDTDCEDSAVCPR